MHGSGGAAGAGFDVERARAGHARRRPGGAPEQRGRRAAALPGRRRGHRPPAAGGPDRRVRGGRPARGAGRGRLRRAGAPHRVPRDEIAVVENATRAWDMAFYSLAFGPGDRILTAAPSTPATSSRYLQVAARTGAVVEVVPNDEDGQLSVAGPAQAAVDGRVKLVAVTHVPTRRAGQSAPRSARVARAAGVPSPAGRLPVGRAAAGRRRAHRVRHALGHRAQVPARAARHRLPLRAPVGAESLEPPFLDLHAATWTGPRTYEIRATRAGSRTGRRTTRARSAWASPPSTRWPWGWTRSGGGSARWRRACGARLGRPRGHACTTRAAGARDRHLHRRRRHRPPSVQRRPRPGDEHERLRRRLRAFDWRAAGSPSWCAPPCTTTTPRASSTG